MKKAQDIRRSVSEDYARALERGSCCSPRGGGGSCCAGPSPKGVAASTAGYEPTALAELPADAVVNSFGCGNPVALGEVRPGDVVLDLGSGAGIDLILAAKLVGSQGRVIGVDMTPAMVERARRNIAEARCANAEVRQGIIEDLPVEDASVDLVISNCVINLSPEKPRVFAELARVLKPGGRFSISDIVVEDMPARVRDLGALHSACVAGAIPEADYLAGLRAAGLEDVIVRDRLVYDRDQLAGFLASEHIDNDEIVRVMAGKVASIRVLGRRPGG